MHEVAKLPAEDARQGHTYSHFGTRVIALIGGKRPTVSLIEGLWLGRAAVVDAADLVALPMRYHGNEVPR